MKRSYSGEPRRSSRLTLVTQESERRQLAMSLKPTGGHVKASGRAIDNSIAPDTFKANQDRLAELRGVSGKDYKDSTMRVHFKGQRNALDDMTPGTLLGGGKIDRGSWNKDQKTVSNFLSRHLKKQPGFIAAPHGGGSHGAEIAHIRPQHAGGMTDALGAQPASWHSNVEDMAREEAQVKLYEKFGKNVRLKSTTYLHETGLFGGTVKASRHKIYFRASSKDPWEKKLDHLQDGHRGNINKEEVKQLREKISALSPSSQTIASKRGIAILSDIGKQAKFSPLTTGNRSELSPYFTDLKYGAKRHAGSEASIILDKQMHKFSHDIELENEALAAASEPKKKKVKLK